MFSVQNPLSTCGLASKNSIKAKDYNQDYIKFSLSPSMTSLNSNSSPMALLKSSSSLHNCKFDFLSLLSPRGIDETKEPKKKRIKKQVKNRDKEAVFASKRGGSESNLEKRLESNQSRRSRERQMSKIELSAIVFKDLEYIETSEYQQELENTKKKNGGRKKVPFLIDFWFIRKQGRYNTFVESELKNLVSAKEKPERLMVSPEPKASDSPLTLKAMEIKKKNTKVTAQEGMKNIERIISQRQGAIFNANTPTSRLNHAKSIANHVASQKKEGSTAGCSSYISGYQHSKLFEEERLNSHPIIKTFEAKYDKISNKKMDQIELLFCSSPATQTKKHSQAPSKKKPLKRPSKPTEEPPLPLQKYIAKPLNLPPKPEKKEKNHKKQAEKYTDRPQIKLSTRQILKFESEKNEKLIKASTPVPRSEYADLFLSELKRKSMEKNPSSFKAISQAFLSSSNSKKNLTCSLKDDLLLKSKAKDLKKPKVSHEEILKAQTLDIKSPKRNVLEEAEKMNDEIGENQFCHQYDLNNVHKIISFLGKDRKIAERKEDLRKKLKNLKNINLKEEKKGKESINSPRFEASTWKGGLDISDYVLGKVIGQGSYAIVQLATHKMTGRKVAIKTYEKLKLLDPQRMKNVKREIENLKILRHPFVVDLLADIHSVKHIHLVMEYIGSINLGDMIAEQTKGCLSVEKARIIMHKMAQAVEFAHSKNIVHRDIKMENVVLSGDSRQIDLKVIDFGFSIKTTRTTRLTAFCGTPSYMAPEIISRTPYFGCPADIWALGVMFFRISTGKFPFTGKSDKELFLSISHGKIDFPSWIPNQLKGLISGMLKVKVGERLTAKQVAQKELN